MVLNSRNNRAKPDLPDDLYPTTELERAYVQARSWSSIHSWRRGTSHLNAARYTQAMGVYLAMARRQMLEGLDSEVRISLLSLVPFTNYSPTVEKVAVVRILCDIVTELNECDFSRSHIEKVSKHFYEVASIFIDEPKSDKAATLTALSCLKHVTGASPQTTDRDERARLTAVVEKTELRLAELTISSTTTEDVEAQRTQLTRDLFDELSKTSGSSKIAYQLQSSCKLFMIRNERINVSLLCAVLLKYVDHCSKNVDLVDLSYYEAMSTIARVAPQTEMFDLMLATLLEQFAKELMQREYIVLASDCLQRSIFAQIRLKNFTAVSRGLIVISAAGLISKGYTDASNLLQLLFETLNDLDGPNDFPQETELFASRQQHLFDTLTDTNERLDSVCLNALNDIASNAPKALSEYSISPLYHEVISLIRNRSENESLKEALPALWKTVSSLRHPDYFTDYAQPLSIITEQLMDSENVACFEYYKRSANFLKNCQNPSGLEQNQLALFWRMLIEEREKKSGKDSYTLLPLLGELAEAYFSAKEFDRSESICHRILSIDKSSLDGNKIESAHITDCVRALLLTFTTFRESNKTNELLEVARQLAKITKLNFTHKPTLLLLHVAICEYIQRYTDASPFLTPLLDEIDKHM